MKPDLLKEKLTTILESKNRSLAANPKFKGREFLLPLEKEQMPLDLPRKEPGFSSYTLEIGSGWGEFTLKSARQDPQNLTLALEKKRKRVIRCLRDQQKAEITNIRWMVLNVDWLFEELFTPESFDKVIINFPDPWPKTRHHKHRFMSPPFIEELSRICKPGAILEFATDHWPYMEYGARCIEDDPNWKNIHGKMVILREIEGRPASFFQELKQQEGENLYFIQFQKSS